METNELAWITDVIAKLQVLQTYNERERLIKILKKAAPAIIAALDYTAMSGFSTYNETDGLMTKAGHSCNGCGQDHYFEEGNAKHCKPGTKRDGTGGEPCRVEDLFHILKELEETEDK
jgi:hypothetical protein